MNYMWIVTKDTHRHPNDAQYRKNPWVLHRRPGEFARYETRKEAQAEADRRNALAMAPLG